DLLALHGAGALELVLELLEAFGGEVGGLAAHGVGVGTGGRRDKKTPRPGGRDARRATDTGKDTHGRGAMHRARAGRVVYQFERPGACEARSPGRRNRRGSSTTRRAVQ